MRRKVVRDEAGRLGAPVAVVDADEGGGGGRLHLALILQHVVGLHDGEGELARRVPREVPRPQQLVDGAGVALAAVPAVVLTLPRKPVPPDPVPARGRNPLQPRPHPSSPSGACSRDYSSSPTPKWPEHAVREDVVVFPVLPTTAHQESPNSHLQSGQRYLTFVCLDTAMRKRKPYGRRNKIASSCLVSLGAPKQAQFAREKREGNHHQEAPRGAARPAGSRKKHRRILRAYQTHRRRLEDRTDDRMVGSRDSRGWRWEGTGCCS